MFWPALPGLQSAAQSRHHMCFLQRVGLEGWEFSPSLMQDKIQKSGQEVTRLVGTIWNAVESEFEKKDMGWAIKFSLSRINWVKRGMPIMS